jgi:hypothetical protein
MYRISFLLAAWLMGSTTRAFLPTSVRTTLPPIASSAAPSDSAALDDEEYSGYGAAAVVEERSPPPTADILRLLSSRTLVASEPERAQINELLVQLEQAGRSHESRTASPLLNGVWELKYVGGYSMDGAIASPTRQIALFLYSGGYSPGVRETKKKSLLVWYFDSHSTRHLSHTQVLAYTLAQQLPSALVEPRTVEITISRTQPRILATAAVQLLGSTEKVEVRARMEVQSDLRFRETYESVTIPGSSAPWRIPKPLQYARDLYITYLDEDLLVVRDASGIPEVLVRPEKQFSKNWGTEPSAVDDLVPPGDGEDASF